LRPGGEVIFRRTGVITAERFTQFLAFLQETIQSGKSQTPAAPQPAASSLVNPLNSSLVLPSAAMPPVVTPPPAMPPVSALPQEMFAAVPPPASRDLFPPQSPAAPYPLATQSPATNSLRTTEMATQPLVEQNLGIVTPPASLTTTAAVRSMLDVSAPAKTTIEVPLALEGFCPVMLVSTEERLVTGNPAYSTLYQGQIFRFSSMEALVAFAQNPVKYAPVAMGEDIVLLVDRNRRVNGDIKFGALCQGRVFLFSCQETQDAFTARANYYAEIALKYETARREQPSPVVY
jgi:YHS domain-containing protein